MKKSLLLGLALLLPAHTLTDYNSFKQAVAAEEEYFYEMGATAIGVLGILMLLEIHERNKELKEIDTGSSIASKFNVGTNKGISNSDKDGLNLKEKNYSSRKSFIICLGEAAGTVIGILFISALMEKYQIEKDIVQFYADRKKTRQEKREMKRKKWEMKEAEWKTREKTRNAMIIKN